MLERDIQKKCVAYARENGCYARKFTAQGRRSVPDYIFARAFVPECTSGWIIFVEFKRPGEPLTELQEEEHKLMRAAGISVHRFDNVEKFKAAIDNLILGYGI